MSQLVFPQLQGLSWEYTKKPIWKTLIQESTSGNETRIKLWSYPKYEIGIKYNFMTNQEYSDLSLTVSDYEKMLAFYNKVGGSYDDFLYEDPIENTAIAQVFGVADGITKDFQLTRTIGAESNTWVEPVYGVKGTPVIKVGTNVVTNYTINNFGLVSFADAPASGNISWTGSFYFRCRFLNDNLQFNQTYKEIYENIGIDLTTVKL